MTEGRREAGELETTAVDYTHELAPEQDEVVTLLDSGDAAALDSFLSLLHPADLAVLFEVLDRPHWPRVLDRLTIEKTSDLMEELPDHLRDDLAEHLRQDQLASIIAEMASDDAADVLADLPENLAEIVISSLEREERREIEALLEYEEDTAGGIMQVELVAVRESATVEETVEEVRRSSEDVGDFHFVHVVDGERRLLGSVRLEQLILAQRGTAIGDIMAREVPTVTPEVDQEQVAQMFLRYDLVSLPVVDGEGRLLGRILHDDIADVIEEEADEDILHMAGAAPHGDDEPDLVYTDRVFKIASVRLPWLIATLGGLTVPAFLVWAFQLSFPHMLVLVPFIPVIGAMGGNVGTQSSTIVVRGFATGHIDYGSLRRFLGRECVIGALMGVVCGLLSGLVAILWHGDYLLCLVVTASMTLAILVSAVMGVLVPWFFRLVNIDPAIAAGPAVTTIDDILAIGIYYGTAVLLVPAA